MQRLEFSCGLRLIFVSLWAKGLTNKFLGISKVNASEIKHVKLTKVIGTLVLLSKFQQHIN